MILVFGIFLVIIRYECQILHSDVRDPAGPGIGKHEGCAVLLVKSHREGSVEGHCAVVVGCDFAVPAEVDVSRLPAECADASAENVALHVGDPFGSRGTQDEYVLPSLKGCAELELARIYGNVGVGDGDGIGNDRIIGALYIKQGSSVETVLGDGRLMHAAAA